MHFFNCLQHFSGDAVQTTSVMNPSHSHLSVWQNILWFCGFSAMYFVLSNNQRSQGLGLVLFEQLLMFNSLMSLFVILSVTMVMGIPTVKRKVKSYLSETLRSLIDKLSPEEKLDCVIIVFVGEVRCRTLYESLHVPAHSLKCCKKGPPILKCGLDPRRLTWTTFTVWLPVWRKSEYFTGRRRRHNDIQWRACVRLSQAY